MSTLWKSFSVSKYVLAPALILGTGCNSPPTIDDLPDRLAASAGVREPVAFTSIGEPTDAAGGQSADLLTLPLAVESAVRHSPAVQAAVARVRVALADSRQTRLLPNPVLSVALRFPEGGGKPEVEAGLGAELLSLLQRPRQASAADARLRAAAGEAVTAVLDVVAEVQEQFLTAQMLDAERVTLNQRCVLLDRLVGIADARLKAGEAGRLDVLTLSSERAELEAEIIENDADRTDRRLVLARLLGQPSADASWPLAPWTPSAIGGSEQAWVAAALDQRPELQARRWELVALGDEAEIARLAFVDGSAGIAAERDDGLSVGPAVDVSLPVFDWGQARRDRANAQVIEARHRLVASSRTIVEEVRRAWASVAAARTLVNALERDLVPVQEQRRTQAETQYRNGAADITALLLAEQDALAGRLKLVQAQSRLAIAYARLQRAVGGARAANALSKTRPTNAE